MARDGSGSGSAGSQGLLSGAGAMSALCATLLLGSVILSASVDSTGLANGLPTIPPPFTITLTRTPTTTHTLTPSPTRTLPATATRSATASRTPTPSATSTPTSTATATPAPDLGDAPDSTNSFGIAMSAYDGVPAGFPSVFYLGSPPWGPRHVNQPLVLHLGAAISFELEADIGTDADGDNNVRPSIGLADGDGYDDGLEEIPSRRHCHYERLRYTVTALEGAPALAYLNVWLDWDRDGAWGAVPQCDGVPAPEWAVRNLAVALPGPGVYSRSTPAFLVFNMDSAMEMWIRITISNVPADPEKSHDGSGPPEGYAMGETEDYLLPGIPIPTGTPSPTNTPTPSRTVTWTPTPAPSDTATWTLTLNPTPSPSLTRAPTLTLTPTPSPSRTKTRTATVTPSPTDSRTPTPSPSVTATRPWVRSCQCSTTADRIYRVEGFRGYAGDSAANSKLIRITSPPAPLGWQMPGYEPGDDWGPTGDVWWGAWGDPNWRPLVAICDHLGVLGAGSRPEGLDGVTHLIRHIFEVRPPKEGMRVADAYLEMWSDNKTAWWWDGELIAEDAQGYQGWSFLYPDKIASEGGTYLLAVQNSNDYMFMENPQGTAFQLCVDWAVEVEYDHRFTLPLLHS